jgi:copper oxidase (laccase) domain-containing protein
MDSVIARCRVISNNACSAIMVDMYTHKLVKTMPSGVKIVFSDVHDGSLATGGGRTDMAHHKDALEQFLQKHFGDTVHTKSQVTYDEEATFTTVRRVTSDNAGYPTLSDALYTTEPDLILTLPVADCIATIVYDQTTHMIGLLHLGRHASVAGLIEAFAIEVADHVGSDPRDWQVWMSPSLKQAHDRMTYFTPPRIDEWRDFMNRADDGMIHIDVVGHNRARFERLGVAPRNITVSPVDTYIDTNYFSHRAAVETNDLTREGRMVTAVSLIE